MTISRRLARHWSTACGLRAWSNLRKIARGRLMRIGNYSPKAMEFLPMRPRARVSLLHATRVNYRPPSSKAPNKATPHATSRHIHVCNTNVRNHAAGVDGCPTRLPCRRRVRPSQPPPLRWLLSWPQFKSSPVGSIQVTSSRVKPSRIKSNPVKSSQSCSLGPDLIWHGLPT